MSSRSLRKAAKVAADNITRAFAQSPVPSNHAGKREASDFDSSDEEKPKKRRIAPTPIDRVESSPSSQTDEDEDFKSEEGIKFRKVRQGHGEVYEILSDDDIVYIGTVGLNTCLAVYFVIDATYCFFAHANFEILDKDGRYKDRHQNNPERPTYQVNDEAYRSVRLQMLDMLNKSREAARAKNWWGGLKKDKGTTDLMRKTLVLASPMSNITGKKYVADALAEAVREWLEIPKERYAQYPIHKQERMIVKHPIGDPQDVVFLTTNFNENGEQVWKPVLEPGGPHFASAAIRDNGLMDSIPGEEPIRPASPDTKDDCIRGQQKSGSPGEKNFPTSEGQK